MRDLLPHFERELVELRRQCREYAEHYPGIAGRLHMSGDACADPHVERLIQASALIAARLSKRLDDDYPQLTEALIESLLPHYLRPFPACAIVRFADCGLDRVTTVARGTELESAPIQGVRCKFKTAYDLTVAPVALANVRFDGVIKAPGTIDLPLTAGSGLRFDIEARPDQLALSQLGLKTLRVFIDGDPAFCAALRDTLFMRTVCACVEQDDGRWTALPEIPVAPVGFAENEALIPFGARSQPAYRALTEYFAFPDKFNFFDIDVGTILAHLPATCNRFTLHLAVAGLRPDSRVARLLGSLSTNNLLLACVPVVNLFRQAGVPISVTHTTADYTVLGHATHARAYEVYAIESVHMLRDREGASEVSEFRPFYSLRHGEGGASKGRYWVMRRDTALSATSPGHEYTITLVDAEFQPAVVETAALSIELSCTNRDLPGMLPYGQTDGDLVGPPVAGKRIRFLRRPTQPYRFDAGHGSHWRLISHLTLNHHGLAREGLPGFREMLTLYDLPRSPVTQRQIGGIVGLDHAPATAWMRHKRGATLVHGIAVRMTLDEEAFVGGGMHLFVEVVDQVLGLYVQINSFIELIVLSKQSGEEVIRCKPRNGDLRLV